jgi:outer membrane immunogenic protein
MRRLIVGLLGLSALSVGAASAADLPAKAPVYKAPVPVVYNWTGIYIGAFGGGLWADKDWRFITGTTTSHNVDGFFGGGQIGVNWQLAPNWVVGAQFDWGWSGASGSAACPNATFNCATKIKSLGSVTGRVGYAWDSLLAYVKGGGAWVEDEYEATGASTFTGSNTPWGWTIGGGLEWGFTRNWSVFAEYDYYGFGTNRITFANAAGTRDDFDAEQRVNVAKVGLNYRFNWRP